MAAAILTLTLNPAVDLSWDADGLNPGHKTRIYAQRQDAGGGGINVARVIRRLGGQADALAPCGGAPGQWLQSLLAREGLGCAVLPIAAETRVCTTIHDRKSGQEYRFVPAGPGLTTAEWQDVLQRIDQHPWTWLIASGSLPPGVPDDFYALLLARAAARRAAFVLDSSGPALAAAVAASGAAAPIAVLKPSLSELRLLTGLPLVSRQEQAAAALGLVRAGRARCVALSLGAEGALLADADGVIMLPAYDVQVHSTVGAGDSFLAALVLALSRGQDRAQALRLGVAAGAAAAESAGTAQPDAARVAQIAHAMDAPRGLDPL